MTFSEVPVKVSALPTSLLQTMRRWRFLPTLLLAITLGIVMWFWLTSVQEQRREVENHFSVSADHAVDLFRERFAFYKSLIYASQGLFDSSEQVTREEWNRFIRSLRVSENYPGVESIYFAKLVKYTSGKDSVFMTRGDSAQKLAKLPARERGFAITVEQSDTVFGHAGIQGYDLASEAGTLDAFLKACEKRDMMLTSVLNDPQTGSLIIRQVMPVFRTGAALDTEEERHQAMLGWLSVNLNVNQWLEHFTKELQDADLSFTMSEAGGSPFYDNRTGSDIPQFHKAFTVELGGHEWVMNLYSTPSDEQQRIPPDVMLFPLVALLLLLMLQYMIRRLQGNERRAEALAERMTDQLRQSEARYRQMFESSKAVELLIDPSDGAIVDANQAAVNYYGYNRDELRRMNISDINMHSAKEITAEMQRAKNEQRDNFLFRHRHATGEIRDVEVHSGPIDVDGKQLLYSIVHDVTARIESEKALRDSEERYHSIIDTTGEGYWLVDLKSLKIVEVNEALCEMLGYCRDELIGHQPFEFADEENRRVFAYQATLHTSTQQRKYEVVLKHKDGHDVIVSIHATNMPHEGGVAEQAFALISDITELKHNEEQLRIAATFFDTTSEAITVTDANNQIVAVNPAFCMITGYSEEEVLGRDPSFLSSGRNNEAFYRGMWETLLRMGRWQGEIWNRRKNGEIYPEWLSIVAIKDEKGIVKQYMAVFSDITKRKRDEQKIWRQANYDALTGLPNRNLFKDRLDQAMHAAHREKSQLALLFIDLDRFKWVNDTLGHASGDLLLQETAQRLRMCVRETDTVARLGGDEFTVLLNEISTTGDVDHIAEMLLRRLGEPFNLDGKEAFVSGSIGIALYPGDAADMEQLIRNADAAMYSAKEAGRNVFRYFTQEMNEAAQRRLKLEADLRRVLEREELLLHYQPIVDGHGKIAGAEALMRWSHPEYGSVAPDEFIPLAEEVGVIVPIEQWAMEQACNDAVKFQQYAGKEFFMSVNVSSVQCKSDQCRMLLGDVLQKSGLTADCLKLEITERVMMDNTETVITLLRDVREMGVRLAVDDFGTGYSSLSYLKQFPIDVLKIDRGFIAGLPNDRDDVALVEAIVAMAHSLNLQVVGEGVETSEQLSFLRSLGCDLIQGFYFSHPLPFQEFTAYLEEH